MSQVLVSMIKPILALFQVQIEGASRDSVELLEPALSKTPETLDAVDVMLATREFVLPMMGKTQQMEKMSHRNFAK